MKTQAVRLEEDTVVLIEALAKERGCRTSDVIRAFIGDGLAKASPAAGGQFRALQAEIIERRRAEHEQALAQSVGSALSD